VIVPTITVPVASGSVRVWLAVKVVGVRDTANVEVPPARPKRVTPSRVVVFRAVTVPIAEMLPADVEIAPVVAKDVPVAAPMLGVTSVGVVARTAEPVPVTIVAPATVAGPIKLAAHVVLAVPVIATELKS
jgi:hypothetical protein